MRERFRRTILVTDGEQRAALAIVRSLGAAGHTVHVCSTSARSLAGASRWARRDRRVANALTAPEQFIADIRKLVRDYAIDMIIPVAEPSLLALLPVRDTFDDVIFPFPTATAFRKICDKKLVLEAAPAAGIAVPSQDVLATPASLLDFDSLRFPIVVKPTRSIGGESGSMVKVTATHAADATALRRVIARIDPRAYPLLLQQRIVGPAVGVFLLIWKGEIVAEFSHLRLREQPPAGGISVYRSSIPLDRDLRDRSLALLRAFDWEGVAMIEYKVEAATGIPYLMEVNGRFWGSLQLAIDAGVDFPRLLVDAATGRAPAPITSYTPNVRSRWLWGDVDHLLARLRLSDEELALPPGAPSRANAIRAFFERHPTDVNEILRDDDPQPFARESLQWFQALGGSR